MSTTIDGSVGSFQYEVDLKIEPPLPDSKAGRVGNQFLKLKQKKDEDVAIVDGQLTVVETNVTSVVPEHDKSAYVSDYMALKNVVKAIAKVAKDAGSSLDGQIVVKDHDNDQVFRLRLEGCNLKVEGSELTLRWPDGTTSASPWKIDE